MKKITLISVAIIIATNLAFSQGTAINTNGSAADVSAILDASSTTKGVLIPRMTTNQRTAIVSPATGLQVYNTDIKCIEMWDGGAWKSACGLQFGGGNGQYPCYTTPGTATANPTSGSCGYTCTLSLTGQNGNVQWQQSTDGVYFSDISGAITAQYNATVSNPTMYYVAKVNTGNCATGYSNVLTVTASGCNAFGCSKVGWTGYDYGYSIIQTSDGGYATAGSTNSTGAGMEDMYLVKFDAAGNISWSRTVGGTSIDRAYSVVQTSDGGYATAGFTKSFGAGDFDMYMAKFDAGGTLQWTKTIGGTGSDKGYSVIQTSDGGYAVAGSTQSFNTCFYVAKLNSSGVLQWTSTPRGALNYTHEGYSIVEATGGGYVIAGQSWAFGGASSVYITKIDASGSFVWGKSVGGINYDEGKSLIKTSDGGYVVSGFTSSYGSGQYDVYLVKFDGSGNFSWAKTIGKQYADYGEAIAETNDGGFAIAGWSDFLGTGNIDMYVVKTDNGGNISWTKTLGDTGDDRAFGVTKTSDGGFAIVGVLNYGTAATEDIYIAKFDASGNNCCAVTRTSSAGSGSSLGSAGSNSSGGTESSGGVVYMGGTKTVICN